MDLIFLVSQPRSGSTFLQALISNNKMVNTANEPWLLLPLLSIYKPDLISAKYDFQLAYTGIGNFLENFDKREDFKQVQREYIKNTYGLYANSNSRYFLDKTPRYYEILEEIHQILPTSKIIILKRNPLAVLSSMIDTWKVKNYQGLYYFSRDLLNAPLVIQDFMDLHAGHENIISVTYESVVVHPEREIKQIYNWLGLKFDKSVLDLESDQKFRGELGDKIQFEAHGQNMDKWEEKMKDKYWGKFFRGYAYFLNSKLGERYGDYHLSSVGIKTRSFERFYRATSKELHLVQLNKENWREFLWFKIRNLISP